jgi:cyclic beta-1,2-glucan synthetase
MYRAGLESILGFQLRGNSLTIDPCIPRGWREYEIDYRRGSTTYHFVIENPHGLNRGVAKIEIGGELAGPEIELVDDGKGHNVRVILEMKPADA